MRWLTTKLRNEISDEDLRLSAVFYILAQAAIVVGYWVSLGINAPLLGLPDTAGPLVLIFVVLALFPSVALALVSISSETAWSRIGGQVVVVSFALTVIVVIGVYANVYLFLQTHSPGAFHTSTLTPADATYLAVTTLTTLGSGDLYPVAAGARLLVTSETVLSFFLLVVGLGLLLSRWRPHGPSSDEPRPTAASETKTQKA
jgi:hypothetical protein